MEDKTLKYVKYIFIFVCLFVIGSIVISAIRKNANDKDYISLYKDVKLFETIDKNFNNIAYEMADNASYVVEGNCNYVSSFDLNGDGYGKRFFDDDKKYQSDNDITKLIPREYFFAYSEKGKFVSGDGYSYYIRTCKDLEEDKFGYNSSDYFKTVVILFDKINVVTTEDGDFKPDFKVIGIYEFHSYDKVDENLKDVVGEEIVTYIEKNGVVTFYDIIDNGQNIDCFINKVDVEIECANKCCLLVLDGKKVQNISSVDTLNLVIEATCDVGCTHFGLSFKYDIMIQDGLWMDITYMSEVNRNETVSGKVTCSFAN